MKKAETNQSSVGWQSWSWVGKNSFQRRDYSPWGKTPRLPVAITHALKSPATGWCSWYAFGTNINASIILAQVKEIVKRKLPLEYILIDDGWTIHGDWLSPDLTKFPKGLGSIAKHLRTRGMKLGLWSAPFLASPTSKIFQQHPDWFVRGHDGRLVEGIQMTRFDRLFSYHRWILDMRLPPVQQYLKEAIKRMVEEWNVSYLKLDFLYAQHFNPHFTSSSTPDKLLRTFLTWIKQTYPHVYVAACGCPLEPAAGVVDAMRISADIALPHLHHKWPWNGLFHTQTLRQLQQNLVAREFTRALWHLDPDVFICHPKYGFSTRQVNALQEAILKARGLKFLGDDLLELSQDAYKSHILPLFKPTLSAEPLL